MEVNVKHIDITVTNEQQSAAAYEGLTQIAAHLKQLKTTVEQGIILANKLGDALAVYEYEKYGEVRVLQTMALLTQDTAVLN